MPKVTDWDNLALEHDYPNPVDMVSDWYYNKDLSILTIGLRLGISDNTVRGFMKANGIQRKPDYRDKAKKAWSRNMAYYVRRDQS